MCGIFGNTAEDRHHAAELDNYLDSLDTENEFFDEVRESCHNCAIEFENDFEIFPFEMNLYCQDCYDAITEEA